MRTISHEELKQKLDRQEDFRLVMALGEWARPAQAYPRFHPFRHVLGRHPSTALMFHSDRGSQYTSDAYRAALAEAGIIVSMSRTGNCSDNAVTKSFFGTLKGECVARVSFQTRGQARQVIFEYVECFYNRVRRHSSLGYVSPVVFEQVLC